MKFRIIKILPHMPYLLDSKARLIIFFHHFMWLV